MGAFSATVKRAWNQNRLMSALLELTYACNLNCEFCYNDLGREGQRLSKEQYFEVLADLARMGVLNLTLSGGEPLAHPHFFAIGAEARRLGFAIRIKSNGHAIRRDVAVRLREEIDPLVIDVSLHGAKAETHDRQTRVTGSFARLTKNLVVMREEGLRVRANCTLTRWNEGEMEALFAFCDDLGITLQVDNEVKPRDDGDRAPLDIAATPEGQLAWIALKERRAAKRMAAESVSTAAAPIDIAAEQASLRRSLKEGVEKHCGAGSATIAIDPFGDVLPCVQWRRSIGSIHDKPVSDMWAASPELDDIRTITRDVKRMIQEQGDDGARMNFCPGAAHTYSGNARALYPAAITRATLAREHRVRLQVVR